MCRVFIHTVDVQDLTGFGTTTSKSMLSSCRKTYGIPKRGPVTFAQFCELYQLDLMLVLELINKPRKKTD